MKKPVMKSEIAIQSEGVGTIYFWATSDAAQAMAEFGLVERWQHDNQYKLAVDARFSFEEVRHYIENYGRPGPAGKT